ncbi:hypothetical protein K438DRAFT_1841252 [Mycena galopus ATCC 62051]|nr:hypothetical protein K438DRAFT_1841252 [Mycena galopus ATCC 62051]
MSAPALATFDANGTIGALLIGTLISYALFGVTSTQTYIYYGRFPRDPLRTKIMVRQRWCGEFGHTICIAMSIYAMVITNYGHPERLLVLPKSLLVSAFLGSVVAFGVQIFFAFRIYSLSKSLWVPCICWALSLFRFVPPNVILFAFGHQPAPELLGRFGSLFDAIWAASAANDLLIAGTLVYLLYGKRDKAFQGTIAIVDKLILWTIGEREFEASSSFVLHVVETGVVTSLNSRAALRPVNEERVSLSTPAVASTLPRPVNPMNLSIEMNKVTMTTYDD